MISLQPREQFMLVRQLADHTDPATYYVRAVIKNSISGEIIATVNLNDNGNGRFTKLWEVPADVSGLGFFIDITMSIYDDSGYTTLSALQPLTNEQYLVFERVVKSSGGGGADIDYKKIQKMLNSLGEEVKKVLPTETDLKPIAKILKEMNASISSIEIPKPKEVIFTPVLEAIRGSEKNIIKSIAEKEVTPETSLEEVLDAVKNKEPNLEEVYKKLSDLRKIFSDFVQYDMSREMGVQGTAAGKLKELASRIMPILGNEGPINTEKPRDRAMSLID